MEIASANGLVITQWETCPTDDEWDRRMAWRDGPLRVTAYMDGGGGVFVQVGNQPIAAVPAEFSRWLAGEGPPKPPIQVGDRVTGYGYDGLDAEVVHVQDSRAWLRDRYGDTLAPLSRLRRVGENDG